MKDIYNRIKYYLKTYGFFKTAKKCISKIICKLYNNNRPEYVYKKFVKQTALTKEELEKQKNHKFKVNPKISVIVPMYNTPKKFFDDLVNCLINQTYSNWELCLADGSPEKNEKIDKIIKKDERIKYKFLNDNKGISGNSNEALKLATGDFISLLDHDDLIAQNALYEIVKCINENPDVEFIYTDEDKFTNNLKNRFFPHFKPDYAPDTLRTNNYICHYSIFKKELIDEIGGFNSEFDGSQDYDIILRATEKAKKIVHIPKVLYHWRVHKNSTSDSGAAKPYTIEAGRRAIEAHIKRIGLKGEVKNNLDYGTYRVEYEIIGSPSVSIMIPSKDNIDILKSCIDSILVKTTYQNYEILIIENNSEEGATFEYYKELEKNDRIRVIYYPEKGFNYSKIINFGVRNSKSEYVIQLNNDTEVLTPNWIEQMLGFCQREDVGAVGAKLYYPDNTIQHAGIIIGCHTVAGHILRGFPRDSMAYFARDRLIQNFNAVTGACLMAKRAIYEEVRIYE